MEITIKRSIVSDAENLVRVQILAFHHDSKLYPEVPLSGPPGYDSVEKMLEKIEQDECYTIIGEDKVIGGIVLCIMGEGHYHLDLIFIDPAYHNLGIGTKAMHFIENTYAAMRWTLDTPLYAVRNQHFYEKLGYIKVRDFVVDDFALIAYEKHTTQDE